MRSRLLQLTRGHEVASATVLAAILGLAIMIAPRFDRPPLLVASAGLLVGVGALAIWVIRDHHSLEWTTSSGAVPRVRGSDRRITALARSIDDSLGGDDAAAGRVRSTLRSLADAHLSPHGLSLDDPTTDVDAVLGRDLTAYLTAPRPRHVNADELASFITTLEEN